MALELPKFTKKERQPGEKSQIGQKITQFFEKNPIMKIIIPVVLFLILVVVFLLVIFGDGVLTNDEKTDGTSTSVASNEVQVVPGNNIIRDKEITQLIDSDPLSPDILAAATYTGSVTGSSGLKTALIQIGTSGDTLVLAIGETIGDSDWELIEVYSDYVIFKAGEVTKKIELAK
ncbi:MAG: hypothetical protein ACI4VW_04575 [Acutalibacteraceae bacterium]